MGSLPVINTQTADDVACGTGVTDGRGRRVRYLRMSVTDRCDMACVYCMPTGYQGSAREVVLSFEEMVRVVRAFYAVGVRTVRLTGGEPLVRRSVVELVQTLHQELPELDLAMTTNGALLAKLAAPLRKAGLRRLNVSVDSLDPARFATITRGGDLGAVLEGLRAAKDAGFTEIKTNTVVLRSHNLAEAQALVEWAHGEGLVPRFIELMPLGEGAALMHEHVAWSELRDALSGLWTTEGAHKPRDRGPAFYLSTRSGGRVGFITAVSNHFCDDCDRVRLTAKGEIRACLASPSGVSLRDIMRRGATDEDLVAGLQAALSGKTAHAFSTESHGEAPGVIMTGVGG